MLKNRIQDILVSLTEYPSIRDNATLRDALSVLLSAFSGGKRFRHLLVLDANGQLVGLLGIRDILRGLFPEYLRSDELHRHPFQGVQPDFRALALIWQETCETQCKEAASNPVRDFMSSVPTTIRPGDPITLAAYLMVNHDASILPVVDDGKVVGVVRMIDVFNHAAEVVLHDN